jgi:hypothetical protein
MTMTKRDNHAVTSPGLAIGTTTTKVNTGLACAYNIGGRAYSKAATADVFTLAGTSLAVRQTCAFFLLLDASGAATVEQSAIKEASTSTSTTTRYVPGAWDWPDPTDKAVIGAVVITTAGLAFVPGTTALTGVAAYVNAGPDYGSPITY